MPTRSRTIQKQEESRNAAYPAMAFHQKRQLSSGLQEEWTVHREASGMRQPSQMVHVAFDLSFVSVHMRICAAEPGAAALRRRLAEK